MPKVSANERAATRTRLLEAGKAEFAERGLAGARFDEIAVAAGHAKGTIYNYFDSKEELFFTIVGEWCALLVDAIDAEPQGSARQRLRRVAELDVEIARKDPDLALVVVQQMPTLVVSHASAVNAALEPGLARLAAIVRAGLEAGEFRSAQSADTIVRLFLSTLSSFELEALLPDTEFALDDVVGLLDRHFLEGFCERAPIPVASTEDIS